MIQMANRGLDLGWSDLIRIHGKLKLEVKPEFREMWHLPKAFC